MMRNIALGLLLAAGLSLPIFADDDDHRRDDRDYRYNRGQSGDHDDDRDDRQYRDWRNNRNRDNRDYGRYRNYDPYRDDGSYRDDGRYRNDGRYRDNGAYGSYGNVYGYGNNGRYGRSGASTVDLSLSDLSRIASRSYSDNHERSHFQKAMQNLQDFNYRYRQGQFDSSRLDRAIDEMKHLADAQQLHPNDRQIIARDIQDLRYFRSNGGRY
jgi:hypothetical protein